jgi:hypothetical protein
MPNVDNINTAIAILERVRERKGKFDLSDFQDGEFCRTEDEAVSCGTAACFSGWVNLSPEWQSQPGVVQNSWGAAIYKGKDPDESMAKWLGISVSQAYKMIYSPYPYGKTRMQDVEICDVICKLQEILDGKLT